MNYIRVSNLSPEELLKEDNSRILVTEDILTDVASNRFHYQNKCLIVPLALVEKRQTMYKVNRLTLYLIMSCRKDGICFVISTPDIEFLDKRIKAMIKCYDNN